MLKIVKTTTFPNPLDLIAPHSCRGCGRLGVALCNRCKNNIIANHQNICPICRQPNPTGKCSKCKTTPQSFIVDYRDTLIGELVHDYKYNSVRALAKPLAEILHEILPPLSQNTVIVPLPTISRHIRERGFDHIALIAKHLAKLRKIKSKPVLNRANNSVQVGTSKSTRKSQAKSAYTLNPKITINPNTTYLLLDDIWTTGASMQAATKKLQQAGAHKIIIVILGLSQI